MTTKAIPSDLPTLDDVLNRKTLPPVCLYNFYIVMRDRLHMEEVLDFYLDVRHHELLWRRYVKSMHRSGHLTEDDLADGYQSPRVLSRLSHNSSLEEKKLLQSPLSSTTTLKPPKQNDLSSKQLQHQRLSNVSISVPLPMVRPPLDEGAENDTEVINEKALPSRQDLIDSAQRILLRYIVPSAQKELMQLPPELKDTIRRELEAQRNDPLVFEDAKEYVFEYMQRQAYPKFLRLKVWGNVTLWQQMGRLVLGLVSLLAGFATALSLIFLGHPPWGIRFWILLPIWVGVFNVFVFLSGLDPIWVLFFNVR
ncbi:Bud site selection protein, Revert to axial protein 1 [Apophysomyces ossiformis]|uniref:Bud site selection protein, Revert to axial protein 1 n=1 Tax=Apophysomyces ossiformis TaxID=679940 RepID=A0A8H7BYL0_9FUNG|nr:Bud site selection protein, Revert to axial protein 1 [Apophysomyces ossiformis]